MADIALTTVGFQTREFSKEDKAMLKREGILANFEWLWCGSGAGDAAGGVVYGTDTFNGNDVGAGKYYYYITAIHPKSVTADMVTRLYINTDEWEKYTYSGIADKAINIWSAEKHTGSPSHRDQLQKAIPLGRPAIRKGNTGSFTVEFSINTNLEQYDWVMTGMALFLPAPRELIGLF